MKTSQSPKYLANLTTIKLFTMVKDSMMVVNQCVKEMGMIYDYMAEGQVCVVSLRSSYFILRSGLQ